MSVAEDHKMLSSTRPPDEEEQQPHQLPGRTGEEASACVKVCVRVRPLVPSELSEGCAECVEVDHNRREVRQHLLLPAPSEHLLWICLRGEQRFTFDMVFDQSASQERVYIEGALPLIRSFMQGYNATIFAYGQTGSGKTFTMGSGFASEAEHNGVIPKALMQIFSDIDQRRTHTRFVVRLSYLEIHNEDIKDLLAPASRPSAKPLAIREDPKLGIIVAGLTEREVVSWEEVATLLRQGSMLRATGSTSMNLHSSRSHAICTISMQQQPEDDPDDFKFSKLHLVDLAGSERAKRTKAVGDRMKEGISINKGLLALGNVISALGDPKRQGGATHVPYRDAKITRLLQDSLGGNSRTLMIACVSPADVNFEETVNTLRYANRARNIENKAVVNRDPNSAELLRLKQQIHLLQLQLLQSRGVISSREGEQAKNELILELKAKVMKMEQMLKMRTEEVLQLKLIVESSGPLKAQSSDGQQGVDVLEPYLRRIMELEEQIQLTNSNNKQNEEASSPKKDGEQPDSFEMESKENQKLLEFELENISDAILQKEKLLETMFHTDEALSRLNDRHYEEAIKTMEQQIMYLEKEREQLQRDLRGTKQQLEHDPKTYKLQKYEEKIASLEKDLRAMKKNHADAEKMRKLKEKSDQKVLSVQQELDNLKKQKIAVQRQLRQEMESLKHHQKEKEKEIANLKRQGQRKDYQLQKLEALNIKQQNVLRRKAEEVSQVTKKMKDLMQKKSNASAMRMGASFDLEALTAALERELEISVTVQQAKAALKEHMEARRSLAKKAELLQSTGLRGEELCRTLQEMKERSRDVAELQSKLAAIERGDTLQGGVSQRWEQIRSTLEAKAVLKWLFSQWARERLEKNRAMGVEQRLIELEEQLSKTVATMKSDKLRHERELVQQQQEYEEKIRITLEEALKSSMGRKPSTNRKRVIKDESAEEITEESEEEDGEEEERYSDSSYTETPRRPVRKRKKVEGAKRNNRKQRISTQSSKAQESRESMESNASAFETELMEELDTLLLKSCKGCECKGKCATKSCKCKKSGNFCLSEDCSCHAERCLNRPGLEQEPRQKRKSSSTSSVKEKERAALSDITRREANSRVAPEGGVTDGQTDKAGIKLKTRRLLPREKAARFIDEKSGEVESLPQNL